jgi:hypothetical protein
MLKGILVLCVAFGLLGCAPGATVEQPFEAAPPTRLPEQATEIAPGVATDEPLVEPSPTAVTASAEPTGASEPEEVAEDAPLFDGITHGYTDDGFPFLGDAAAPVTLIDYSDFL